MRRAVATILVAVIGVAAGCGDGDPGGTGAITYSRSGGIAGVVELIEIDESGQARLTLGSGTDSRADCFVYAIEYGDESATSDSVTSTEAFFDAAEPLERLIAEHRR